VVLQKQAGNPGAHTDLLLLIVLSATKIMHAMNYYWYLAAHNEIVLQPNEFDGSTGIVHIV
jgi:hypothetical protein